MPRVKTQTVPPSWQALYDAVFGDTIPVASTGPTLPELTDLVRSKYPPSIEPPHVPTAGQLAIRAAFRHAAELLDAAPFNERHAYWQLAQATGFHSMHYYRHVNIGIIYDGAPDSDIERPDTWTTEPERAVNVPWLIANFTDDGTQTLDYEFTLDPGTFRHWSGHISEAPYEIYLRNIYDGGDYDVITTLATFNPTVRTLYKGTLELPPGEGSEVYGRRVVFVKQINELDRFAPLWLFKVRNVTQEFWAWYYEQLTGDEPMTQYSRPSSDLYVGSYTDQGGGSSNLYQTIDETPASDTDYIRSPLTPSSAPYVCGLGSIQDPLSSSDHIINVRYKKDPTGGPQINLVIELRQGYTNEGSPGTLIATRTYNNISDSWTDQQITLTGGEADSITNYAALALRFVATQA